MDPHIKSESKDQYQYLHHHHPQPALPAYNRGQPYPHSQPSNAPSPRLRLQPSQQCHDTPLNQSQLHPCIPPPSSLVDFGLAQPVHALPSAPTFTSLPSTSPPASATVSPAAAGIADSYTDSPPALSEHDGAGGKQESEGTGEEGPARKKQKRNKPTLSCQECVERKTKCDRGRPHCIACIKRQTECRYAHVATRLQEPTRSTASGRRVTVPSKKKAHVHKADSVQSLDSPSESAPTPTSSAAAPPSATATANHPTIASRSYMSLSTGLLSDVPYSLPSASNVFGIGSSHPFANYWTCGGGLEEVVHVMPQEDQVNHLIDRYFDCVDPVYPMIHRQTFYADYAQFRAALKRESEDGRRGRDTEPDFVALLLIVMALGMQFAPAPTTLLPKDRKQISEFYASGSNQALRIFSYLSTASIRSIQTMVLITYFLINDNHCSDGWAFAGILMRQAYAMGLHRDPSIVTPNASIFEKHQRRKLWQAVLLQDTFLTVLLSLPPSATHTDVSVDHLIDDEGSISISDPTDMAYIRGSWTLANLVQETICSPRSLDMPLCSTPRHKSKLVSDFRAVYRSFPDVFRSWDATSLAARAKENPRVVKQTLFLTSNYFHNLMLVHASSSTATAGGGTDARGGGAAAVSEVTLNVRGTLDAAHDAIAAFFVLFDLFDSEARVWWVFNHRAFLEALCIGDVLKAVAAQGQDPGATRRDPLFTRAKADIARMIKVMETMGAGEHGSEVARTRVEVLSQFL